MTRLPDEFNIPTVANVFEYSGGSKRCLINSTCKNRTSMCCGTYFETLRFRGSVFFRSDLSAPWGMALQQMDAPRFHIIRTGSCYVGAEDESVVNVNEMEIVMLPGGHSHWIADQPGRELLPAEQASDACELGKPLFPTGRDNKPADLRCCPVRSGVFAVCVWVRCRKFSTSMVCRMMTRSGLLLH